uniref:Uncharacterized protein n=1 Tax=Ascaris lumbricoides TaxID=6252 RepID=A0A0M3IJ74_ASCLU
MRIYFDIQRVSMKRKSELMRWLRHELSCGSDQRSGRVHHLRFSYICITIQVEHV